MSKSQDSIKNILRDLCDIINDMNRDRNEPQDFELLRKINDISNWITQVNLGQESVKEVMTKLKSSVEGNLRRKKRGHYQTVDCATPHYEEKTKQPRLSTEFNFSYLNRQYGEILEVPKNREVRRGLKGSFLELHETAQKWEILNYHLKVICTDNQGLDPPPALDSQIYLKRMEAYLKITMVSKLFKHMGFTSKQHPDYKSFQRLISTMFQGLVERKISPAMVYHWLTHQVYWSLCQYEYNKELNVLTDMILLYREFNPATKQPYENVRGPFLHMPELYEKEIC